MSVIDSIQNNFKQFVYRLERKHAEYDLGSEHVIKMIGSVKKARLVVGERAYHLVVIPSSMANMDNTTGRLLKEYLAQGGRILSFTREIPYIDGIEGKTMQDTHGNLLKPMDFCNQYK